MLNQGLCGYAGCGCAEAALAASSRHCQPVAHLHTSSQAWRSDQDAAASGLPGPHGQQEVPRAQEGQKHERQAQQHKPLDDQIGILEGLVQQGYIETALKICSGAAPEDLQHLAHEKCAWFVWQRLTSSSLNCSAAAETALSYIKLAPTPVAQQIIVPFLHVVVNQICHSDPYNAREWADYISLPAIVSAAHDAPEDVGAFLSSSASDEELMYRSSSATPRPLTAAAISLSIPYLVNHSSTSSSSTSSNSVNQSSSSNNNNSSKKIKGKKKASHSRNHDRRRPGRSPQNLSPEHQEEVVKGIEFANQIAGAAAANGILVQEDMPSLMKLCSLSALAKRLALTCLEHGLVTEPRIYNSLLGGFASENRFREWRQLVNLLVVNKLINTEICTTILSNMAPKTDLFSADDLLLVYSACPSPNARTQTSLMSGLNNRGYYNEAVALFEQMYSSSDENCKPTEVTFAIAARACAASNRTHLVKQLLTEMSARGYKISMTMVAGVLSRVAEHCALDETEDIWAFVTQTLGLPPNIPCFTAVVHQCILRRRYERAMELVKQACDSGLQPDASFRDLVLLRVPRQHVTAALCSWLQTAPEKTTKRRK